MALRLQFYTLVIPRDRLSRCADLPAWMRTLNPDGGHFLDAMWYDAHLWCSTAMNGMDVDEEIADWEARGLAAQHAGGEWVDLCLCASRKGPLGPCAWLGFDSEQNTVWLKGAEPGEPVGGSAQADEMRAAMAQWEAAGEAAYAEMYEARRPKDNYEDACQLLSRAAEAARFLHWREDQGRLEARLAHIRAVYDHQMRGF